MDKGDYNYTNAGFDGFMNRSIDNIVAPNLDQIRPPYWPQQVAYDRVQTSGSLGDKITVGSIVIDGASGRISVYDGPTETIRIGNL